MPPIFSTYKSLIDAYLLHFLTSKKTAFSDVNTFGPDVIDKIQKNVVAGKTIRGSLVLVSYCFTNNEPSDDALKIAAAMELMQTALVIHDDIMDHDQIRRGLPSLHVQYKSEAMAMCVGDILFFLAFELLGQIKNDRIIRFAAREYALVGIAQMADVAKTAKTKEELLSLYTYKTARYTFALPLILGAILAGAEKKTLTYLESFGVAVGVLFQIRDDMLDKESMLGAHEIEAYQKAAVESIKRLPNIKLLSDLLEFVMTRTI